ncbi:MAG: O-antigen polysaccharide polymerase Wzy [Opitutae bacterium]|nr:O-antigen polysaccharide polymerase Wzy [Opitutae bacterium]
MEFVNPRPQPDETVVDYSILGGAHAQRGRKLFLTGLGLLAAALAYLAYRADVGDILHLYLGLIMFALAAVPALLWARDGGSRFPVFETVLILTANAYAMPVLNRHEQLAGYSPEVITRACLAVIIYQLTAIITYQSVRGLPGRTRFWRESLISTGVEKFIVYGLIGSTVYIWISTFTSWVPGELESILRAVFYGVGILCTFISTQRWGRGELTRTEKIVLVCTLVPQLLVMCIGLILISAISLIGIALLGYLSGGKRIPWVVFAAAFAILAVLHTGKTPMREKYWEQKLPQPTVAQLPAYFAEWFEYGLQPSSEGKTASQKMLERTSLMHILCLIIDYTPARQDYFYGKTYGYVIPQLVPRFFWPEKPRSHIATYELAIYYGLQDEQATSTTTIAFGLLAEAYANFGLFGAFLLGLFWGFWLKKLQIWSTFSPMFSFAGLFMVLLTAWAFSAELTMAAWVSSLEQAVIVVLGAPLLIRALLGR